jgi:hypothetical protein
MRQLHEDNLRRTAGDGFELGLRGRAWPPDAEELTQRQAEQCGYLTFPRASAGFRAAGRRGALGSIRASQRTLISACLTRRPERPRKLTGLSERPTSAANARWNHPPHPGDRRRKPKHERTYKGRPPTIQPDEVRRADKRASGNEKGDRMVPFT